MGEEKTGIYEGYFSILPARYFYWFKNSTWNWIYNTGSRRNGSCKFWFWMAGIELSSAVKNAIFFPDQKDVYVPALERYHYSAEWSYCVAMIEVLAGAQKIEKQRLERLQKYIENHLSYRHQDVIIFIYR